MKRMFTVIAMLICTLMTTHAQVGEIVWSKNFGGSSWETAYTMRIVNNRIVVAGTTHSPDGNFAGLPARAGEFFIFKTEMNGEITWRKKYGGSGTEMCYSMEPTADGGFILVGSTASKDGDATNSGYHDYNGNPDAWILKINSGGIIEWQRALGGTNFDQAMGVAQTDDDGDGQKDDGYIIVGYTNSNDGDVTNHHGDYDTWVIKMSATGTFQWQRALGGTARDAGYDIEQTPDGGFLLLSETYSVNGDVVGLHKPAGATMSNYSDIWLTKLNADGSIIEWSKAYGGDYAELAIQFTLIDDDGDGQKDDGFVLTGASNSDNGDVPLPKIGGYDVLLIKFDFNGNIDWQRRFGGTNIDRGHAVEQTLDGGFIISGSTRSTNGPFVGKPARGEYDYMLLKYDASGNFEWVERMGGNLDDEGLAVQQASAGCYVMAGASGSTTHDVPGNYGNVDVWMLNYCEPTPAQLPVKLVDFKARYEAEDKVVLEWSTSSEQNNDRFEIQRSVDGITFHTVGTVKGAGTSFNNIKYQFTEHGIDGLGAEVVYYRLRQVDLDGKSAISPVVLVRPKPKKGGNARVWPNPTDGLIQVQLKNAPSGQVRATVYNANGQVIMKSNLLKTTNEISLKGKNAGTYFIRLEDNNGLIQIQQVILK
jgi:hypothetical protein